ncbi:MAG: helix-turn-helix domain-containing protein [Flexibacteraceae bacterium]
MDNNTAILKKLTANNASTWLTEATANQIKTEAAIKAMQIAIHIGNQLEAKGISQKTLAAKLQVSPQYISRLLKGKQNLSLETITALELALDISLVSIAPVALPYEILDTPLAMASESSETYQNK